MPAPTLRLTFGLLCLGLTLPGAALAAKKAAPPSQVATTVAAPGRPDTVWTAAEPANCARARRKLWQDGEGWLVKTVTVCH